MRGNVKVTWEHVEMCPVFEETIEEPDGLAVFGTLTAAKRSAARRMTALKEAAAVAAFECRNMTWAQVIRLGDDDG